MGTFFQGRDALQKHTQPSLLAPFPTAFKCVSPEENYQEKAALWGRRADLGATQQGEPRFSHSADSRVPGRGRGQGMQSEYFPLGL